MLQTVWSSFQGGSRRGAPARGDSVQLVPALVKKPAGQLQAGARLQWEAGWEQQGAWQLQRGELVWERPLEAASACLQLGQTASLHTSSTQ